MKKVSLILALALCLAVLFPSVASAQSYSYARTGEAVPSPDAFFGAAQISLEYNGKIASSPQDLFVASTGEIYIADTGNNRILILDKRFNIKGELTTLKNKNGDDYSLDAPEGVFVTDDGRIYIADTANHRIVCCDRDGNIKQTAEKPTGLIGISDDSAFNPTKLLVDSSDRIYVVARNYNLGILQLDPQGNFVGYIGAPKVQYNLIQMLWRAVSTEEQLSKMEQYVPTEYNNIAIDSEGFVYGTIGTIDRDDLKAAIASKDTSGSVTPVTKLNTNGSDVLKRNGAYAPLGDLDYDEEPSKIIDVAAGASGIYALLDSTLGHIFVYDVNGNLLCAFGGIGERENDFGQPSSISFSGRQLLVLDALYGRISVFSPTDYGTLIADASDAQYNGDFDKAYALWAQVAEGNRNFEYAFVGLGQSYMSEGEYEKAMECFRYANDKENYSRAKKQLRKDDMKTVFPVIFIGIICLAAAAFIFAIARRVYRYVKGVGREDR